MVKNYLQNIPSELYDSYTDQICKAYRHGFLFYLNGYDYTATRAIKVKVLTPLGPRNKNYPDNIFDTRARSRFAFWFCSYSWQRTILSAGEVPPLTGQRSKNWWVWKNTFTPTRAYEYYTQKTISYVHNMFSPPWYQQPVFYLADKTNNKITRINTNTETILTQTGSYGSGNGQFSDIRAFYDDDNLLYVCDAGNHRIQIFDKVSLTWLKNITTFDYDNKPIVTPTAICTDDEYIYFFDSGYTGIKKIKKDNYNNCITYDIKKYAGESTPIITSLENTYENIYLLDSTNKRILLFSKLINSFMSELTTENTISQIVIADDFLYATDTTRKKIICLGHNFLYNIVEIGPDSYYNISFNSVSQICISGNLLFVYDNTARIIWKIDRRDFSVINTWDISAVFGTEILLLNEPQQFFKLWH